jgi:hypothetical protein
VNAYGGAGGEPGSIRFEASPQGFISFTAPVTIQMGNGGDGGKVIVWHDPWPVPKHPRGLDGGTAWARGGRGGKSIRVITATGNITGDQNVTITNGCGGTGGWATATSGAGQDDIGPTYGVGGDGGLSTAFGGDGGESGARFRGTLAVIAPGAFRGGRGGDATSTAANGGAATIAGNPAVGAAGCPGAKGGDATAVGGNGKHSRAVRGTGGRSNRGNGVNGNGIANGGFGGNATAMAGDGGPGAGGCPCNGGIGGKADATGGAKGTVGGPAGTIFNPGSDGTATANGGKGGSAITYCCPPAMPPSPGGSGGKGGDAVARTGANGATEGKGGDGGNGFFGEPPGAGGPAGSGTGIPIDIPDGNAGAPGGPCPLFFPGCWWSKCDGPINPGAKITWTIYDTLKTTQRATSDMHFLTQSEAGFPVVYMCDTAHKQVSIQSGGFLFDMTSIKDISDPTLNWFCTELRLRYTGGGSGEIQIFGMKDTAIIGQQKIPIGQMGEVIVQAPGGEPFTAVKVVATGPIFVDEWSIRGGFVIR